MSSALLGCLLGSVISWSLPSLCTTTTSIPIFFYQGLALKKLNRDDLAKEKFTGLLTFGKKQLQTPFKMDYFAVSLPDLLIFEEDMQKRHEAECHYLIGLGHLGLGDFDKANVKRRRAPKHL